METQESRPHTERIASPLPDELKGELWQSQPRIKIADFASSPEPGLAHLSIDDDKTAIESTAVLSGGEAVKSGNSVADASVETETKAQAKKEREAGTLLFTAAENAVNQSIYRLPAWARLPKPVPGLGCVSSFSNRYRETLQMAGIIKSTNDREYRNFYQVNMDDLNKSMGNLIRPISVGDAREGDVIQGLNRDTHKRHMGIVGSFENGQRMVYHNFSGTWRKDPLQSTFEKYKEHNYYRVYLPQKQ